ncbi:MCE family protein [Aeromicrobium sp. YIM 150415]|uniref:MCE family protein n=1 Tax=Aeromicrobium sp. YIM 150415 TaxID=2803912 RepID=UPI001963EB03|nr:MCE family protein [Aeromicrobium sp. YIM 150415]MBM9462362.1 MCE family protein [Aeromicrobium sp. YIM 150415]
MKKTSRLLDAVLGLGYLALGAALVVASMLAYNKAFTPTTDVLLRTGAIGNALQTGSDVKLNGVPVGEVSRVHTDPGGAELTLALEPGTAESLPAGTTARLLPKTLFGERYVSLVVPATSTQNGLAAGDVLHQDDSDEAVELEELFDELLPVLQAIQPEKLQATLGELSTMLRGRGEELGASMSDWSNYLEKLNPHVPMMAEDLAKLAEVADVYEEALPDLLSAFDSMTTTSATLVDQRATLSEVWANVITASNTTEEWMRANQQTIVVLSAESRRALEAAAPYARQFPCLFDAARNFIEPMDRTLGKGTNEPGIHVVLNVVPAQGKYVPGADAPQYATGGQPRCPYQTGQTGSSGASALSAPAQADEPEAIEQIAAPRSDFARQQAALTGLGDANSPAENQLFAELLAPAEGVAPSDYPQWSSLVVGPALRGAEVTLR